MKFHVSGGKVAHFPAPETFRKMLFSQEYLYQDFEEDVYVNGGSFVELLGFFFLDHFAAGWFKCSHREFPFRQELSGDHRQTARGFGDASTNSWVAANFPPVLLLFAVLCDRLRIPVVVNPDFRQNKSENRTQKLHKRGLLDPEERRQGPGLRRRIMSDFVPHRINFIPWF